jgi:hypothetical protein
LEAPKMADPIKIIFRDFNRYTGDGLPNEPDAAPLPVGDPESGAFVPTKKQLRDLIGEAVDGAENSAAEAEAAAADAASATNPKVATYDTKSLAAAGNIPSYIDALRVSGDTVLGDGLRGLYKRVASQPAVHTKFQSADGAWWSQVVDKTVFILSTGQSNMQRHPDYTWTPPPNLYWWNNAQGNPESVGTAFISAPSNKINPALATAAHIALENPESAVYVLNCAMGGRAIASWLPSAPVGEDVYQNIIDNISNALTKSGVDRVSALLWWQGENGGSLSAYPSSFETVITRFRDNSWFPRATPTVIFGVTPTSRGLENRYDLTNLSLQDIALSSGAFRKFIDTEQFTSNAFWDDTVHMNGLGYFNVGRMAAEAMLGRATFIPKRLSGQPAYIVDANAEYLGSGSYTTSATTINLPAATSGILKNEYFNPNFSTQEFFALTNGRRWRRRRASGAFTPWRLVAGVLLADTQGAAAQTASGTTTKTVSFTNELSDTLGLFNGTTFSPPAGVWKFDVSVRCNAGVGSTESLTLTVKKADSSATYISREGAPGEKQVSISGVIIADGSTSYIVTITGDEGASKTIQSFGPVTYLHATALDGGLD